MDRGAWWATVHKVAQSQTRLKPLSRHHAILKIKLELNAYAEGEGGCRKFFATVCYCLPLGVLKGPLAKEETEML